VSHLKKIPWTFLAISLLFMQGMPLKARQNQQASTKSIEKIEQSLPIEELSAFSEAFRRIKSQYIEPVEDKVLLEGAIRGMMETLDPHSRYLNPQALDDLESSTSGDYNGLGIEVIEREGKIVVNKVLPDSPAQQKGILKDDQITEINNNVLKGLTLDESLNLLRGGAGDKVKLALIRAEQPQMVIRLNRAKIHVNSTIFQLLEGQIGYIKIEQFQVETASEIEQALKSFQHKHHPRLNGLVLDLRDNPGGVLSAAIEVADLFISSGIIVSTKGRDSLANSVYYATKGDILSGAPIVVLINNGSASASEIVAGALQDHKRGLLMGTRSFGKGSVQTVWDLGGGGGIKLTTARYYTPSERTIQGGGIIPDVEVFAGTFIKKEQEEMHESDLPGTLTNNQSSKIVSVKITQIAGTDPSATNHLMADDNQLREALNALRAMVISSNFVKKHAG